MRSAATASGSFGPHRDVSQMEEALIDEVSRDGVWVVLKIHGGFRGGQTTVRLGQEKARLLAARLLIAANENTEQSFEVARAGVEAGRSAMEALGAIKSFADNLGRIGKRKT